jgi:hypothetical protein
VKHDHHDIYEPAKRYVHGRAYGLTVPGMVLQFPHLFPTQKIAQQYARIYEQMAPKVASWQRETQTRASRQHYLGGAGDHPFAYKHWFWSVYQYKRLTLTQYYRLVAKYQREGEEPPVVEFNGQHFKISLGEDGKRVLAFYPQSISAGILKEACRKFADRDSRAIGEVYFGRTPLRAPIRQPAVGDSAAGVGPGGRDRLPESAAGRRAALPGAGTGRAGSSRSASPRRRGRTGRRWKRSPCPATSEWVAEPIRPEDDEDWSDLQRVIA